MKKLEKVMFVFRTTRGRVFARVMGIGVHGRGESENCGVGRGERACGYGCHSGGKVSFVITSSDERVIPLVCLAVG